MTRNKLAAKVAQELINQLKASHDTTAVINAVGEKRHTEPHKTELYRLWKAGMPEDIVRKCGLGLLTKHHSDRTEAVDTMFSYSSPYGRNYKGGVLMGKGGLDDG